MTNATFTSGCVHGHRAWFRFISVFSAASRPHVVQVFDRHVNLHPALRSPPALRSSISSEGSLLFVVCPSRISTHSVSNERNKEKKRKKKKMRIIISLPLSLSLARSLFPLSSFQSSSLPVTFFANEDDKTALSRLSGGPRGDQNGDGGVARPLLHHPAQSTAAVEHATFTFLSFADPFADAIKGSDDDVQDGLVHIRIQQRNGRKTLTTVQGLSSEYDLKKIVRACKKVSERVSDFLPLEISADSFSYLSTYLPFPLVLLLYLCCVSPSPLPPTTLQSGRTLKIGLMQTIMNSTQRADIVLQIF